MKILRQIVLLFLCMGMSFTASAHAQFAGGDGRGDVMAEIRNWVETVAEDPATIVPIAVELQQNYPNPFNPSTRIRFSLPDESHVKLEIINVVGKRVATLLDEQVSPGWHDINFDATQLSSGVYILRLEAGNEVLTRSMTLLR